MERLITEEDSYVRVSRLRDERGGAMGMACLVVASVLTSMAAFGFEVTKRRTRTSAALSTLQFTKTTCALRTITNDWT